MPSNSTFSTVASVAGGVVATALVIWPLAVWYACSKTATLATATSWKDLHLSFLAARNVCFVSQSEGPHAQVRGQKV